MFVSKQKPRKSELKTTRGFSLIEMILVATILAIGSTFSMLIIGPALQARASEMASRTVSMELRRARQLSVDTRRLLRVTFTDPKTITLDQQGPASEVANPSGPAVTLPSILCRTVRHLAVAV